MKKTLIFIFLGLAITLVSMLLSNTLELKSKEKDYAYTREVIVKEKLGVLDTDPSNKFIISGYDYRIQKLDNDFRTFRFELSMKNVHVVSIFLMLFLLNWVLIDSLETIKKRE